ncbi:MAG: molybdopterin-dependent oxidoreductase [Deferrisomatales bacterium]|nr:molybdopterin-dependent oxidoreductase [Deferrisomatales bacterium]
MPVVTSCTLDCPDRCSLVADAGPGGVHLRGDPDHPYTRGFTCTKIRRYPGRLTSPHRIREPWVRSGDHFRQASWEEALDLVCGALRRACREDPASVLHVRGYGSMGMTKVFVERVFSLLGARTTRGSLCEAAGIAALALDAGRLDMNDPREIDAAEAVVLWGKRPRASSIHTAAQVAAARKRGAPVVAVDPDPGSLQGQADAVLRVAPGTDRFLALACARLLLDDPRCRAPWDRAANPEAFRALLARHELDELLAACGLARADAQRLASLYAATPRVATILGWGAQRHPLGGENVRAVHALAFLAGTLGRPGGGLYYAVPSSRHLRPPGLEGFPTPEPLLLPLLSDELGRARPPVRLVWFTCSNLLNQGPDAKALREAFDAVETRVVVDGFWTETARRATVVLPAVLWLEEEDLAASYWHGGIGPARRVVDPPEGCRTDFEIASRVADRLGVRTPWPTADEWLAACLPPGTPSLEEVRRRGWHVAPVPPVAWADGSAHPDGKFRLLEHLTAEPPPDPAHPFRLLTLIRADALHSQLLPEEQRGPLPVRLNAETAAGLGLEAGSPVRLAGTAGELEGEVHLDPLLHPGAVACPRGGWLGLGQGVNEATTAALTDLGEGAAYYGTRVRVEPATHRRGGP